MPLPRDNYFVNIPSTEKVSKCLAKSCFNRPVVPGCAGCAMAHPIFRRPVNPISTRSIICPPYRGDRLCLITTGIPRFSDLPTALVCSWLS